VKKIIIAIDGYSSCGKSTIARDLAYKLNYHYVDTGAMYRALTLYLYQNQIDILHPEMVAAALPQIKISFGFDEITQTQLTLLNGENVEREIRINPRIASLVSEVSALSSVRKFLVDQQKEMGKERGIVMDGRDIGTVVFPDAELKLFITADPKIRAERRLEELAAKGQQTTFNEVLANLTKRDHIDTSRLDSPLKKASDAIEIDNSFLSKKDQFEKVYQLAMKAIGEELSAK
jgi:cytidylate kinase